MEIDLKDYYIVWAGALNLGDTAGVFNYAQFAGLILQIPVTLTYPDEGAEPTLFLLRTTDVETFSGKHPIFWDWSAGSPLSSPVGYIDNTEFVSGMPEYHLITVSGKLAKPGRHTITILINPDVAAGLKDDFVLEWIGAHNTIGAKIGW